VRRAAASSKRCGDGPQLLVVAPGGHIGMGSPLGDEVIAYALPPTDWKPATARR
jgi:glucose dehydrogenase